MYQQFHDTDYDRMLRAVAVGNGAYHDFDENLITTLVHENEPLYKAEDGSNKHSSSILTQHILPYQTLANFFHKSQCVGILSLQNINLQH
jgi:hypothetical protein